MKFGIITPTLLRDSLHKTCQSLDAQTHQDWRHIIMIDTLDGDFDGNMLSPRRVVRCCEVEHKNFGNTCRHAAWTVTVGCDYVLHLDDDNYLADSQVLADIATALDKTGLPDWACFPILRFGSTFFNEAPRSCHADTANIVVRREFGRWPDRPEYTADGFWIEALRDHQPELTFASFGDFRPIVVVPVQGKGERSDG